MRKEEGWSFDTVEARLVEAVALWRRSPGGGRWPFAGDGPWHLLQAEAGDYDARGGDLADTTPPRVPLTRAEVARRDEAGAWLATIPDETDRRIVIAGVAWLDRGRARVPWRRVKHALGLPRGEGAIARRYALAVAGIACRLNGWPGRYAREMAARTAAEAGVGSASAGWAGR